MSDQEKVVYIVTHAGEDPERATFPFTLATAAQAMDVEAVVALQGTGVYLAQKHYAESVAACGLKPLKELLETFMEFGGKLLVCQPCIKERKISEDDLIANARVTAAGQLNQEILSATATLVY